MSETAASTPVGPIGDGDASDVHGAEAVGPSSQDLLELASCPSDEGSVRDGSYYLVGSSELGPSGVGFASEDCPRERDVADVAGSSSSSSSSIQKALTLMMISMASSKLDQLRPLCGKRAARCRARHCISFLLVMTWAPSCAEERSRRPTKYIAATSFLNLGNANSAMLEDLSGLWKPLSRLWTGL